MKLDETINYYNQNAEAFTESTINVDFVAMQDKFLNKLNKGDYILDFGCGSGRDTKYFLEQGYLVDATDGSKELCKMASNYAGIHVKHMLFQDLQEVNKYDAIWACSSILHLPYEELVTVMKKMVTALKETGLIYTSFRLCGAKKHIPIWILSFELPIVRKMQMHLLWNYYLNGILQMCMVCML